MCAVTAFNGIAICCYLHADFLEDVKAVFVFVFLFANFYERQMSAFGAAEVSDSLFSTGVEGPGEGVSMAEEDQQQQAVESGSNTKARVPRAKRARSSGAKKADTVEKFYLDFNLVYNEDFQAQAEASFPTGWAQLQPGAPLRRGKWSEAESKYVDELVKQFHHGLISRLPEGTSLRAYLATALRCDPMRITKKYQAEEAIGKRIYRNSGRAQSDTEMKQAEATREKLAMKFVESLNDKANRKRNERRSSGGGQRAKASRKNNASGDSSKNGDEYGSFLGNDSFTDNLPIQSSFMGGYPSPSHSVNSFDQGKGSPAAEADSKKGTGNSYLDQMGGYPSFNDEQPNFEVEASAIEAFKTNAEADTAGNDAGASETNVDEGRKGKSKKSKTDKPPTLISEDSEKTNGKQKNASNGGSEKKKVKLSKQANKKSKSRKSKRNRLSSVDSTNSEVRAAEMLRSLSSDV